MLDFKVLIEIKRNAKKSIKTDSAGMPIPGNWNKLLFYILFIVVPLIAASAPWFLKVKLS